MFRKRKQISWWIGATIAAALLFVSASQEALARGDDPLRLRVSDAIGTPGGRIAFVLRTYAPRPITQGQVYLKIRRTSSGAAPDVALRPTSGTGLQPPSGTGLQPPSGDSSTGPSPWFSPPSRPLSQYDVVAPVETVLGSGAFSAAGDATSATSVSEGVLEQIVFIQFSSASGTINEVEGPLAAMTFQLSTALFPQEVFSISIDPNRSSFVDSAGIPVVIEPLEGTLTVRAPGDPLRVELDADKVEPGETAILGMETFEPVAVASGQVAFRFDPNIAAGPAVVTLDARYGHSVFFVDQSTPGLVFVSFWSPDNSLNLVPGGIVSFKLPTSSIVPSGSRYPISFDPSLTFLLDPGGNPLPLDLNNGELAFR